MEAVSEILNREQNRSFDNRVANKLKRGYASLHHLLAMHGSYENVSDRSRRPVVLNVMSSRTLENTANYYRLDALKDFPAMDQDKVLHGNFFLLFESDRELKALGKIIPMVNQAALLRVINTRSNMRRLQNAMSTLNWTRRAIF